ncbi:MAG TPA: M48 family metalloprotease [Stenotrophobium sp.]|nr:M48 family metalloprotease [Stenotrophobium sp.]
MTKFSQVMSALRLATCVALAASLATTPLYAANAAIDLPQLGDPADNALSPAQEYKLGSEVVAELYANDYIVDDPEVEDYLNRMGQDLAAHSATKPPPLTFFMVGDPRINAFALPGGFIGINIGLFLAVRNESELAGVLGHEMAHVTQRHIARSQQDNTVANALTWAGVLAAILAGSVSNPNLVLGAISAGQAINYQRQVSYTRAHEQEADRIGIRTMAAAGYDPNGMATFFERLEQQSRLYGSRLPEILLTHPLSTTRIAEARARIAEMPKIVHKDSIDLSLLQARVRVMAVQRPSEATDYFGGELAAGHDTPASRYGYADALLQMGRTDEALKVLAPALQQLPQQAQLNLLEAEIRLAAHQTSQALATYAKVYKWYPNYAPGILAYADALISSGNPDQARRMLIDKQPALAPRIEVYSLLARAARQMGNLPESAYQMATYLYLRGDKGNALAQLDAGLRLPDLDGQEKAKLIARRQEIRNQLPDNWRPGNDTAGQFSDTALK